MGLGLFYLVSLKKSRVYLHSIIWTLFRLSADYAIEDKFKTLFGFRLAWTTFELQNFASPSCNTFNLKLFLGLIRETSLKS